MGNGDGAILQVGADNSSDQRIGFSLKGQTSTHLNLEDDDLTSLANAQTAIDALDDAIQQINDERATIGSKQIRLEYTSSNLMNSIQNNSASMSTIRDANASRRPIWPGLQCWPGQRFITERLER